MASDEDYMAFLNKANQDTGSATAQSSEKPVLKAKDEGSEVPREIIDVCQQAVYVSEADEPFEEVSLRWDGQNRLPTECKQPTNPTHITQSLLTATKQSKLLTFCLSSRVRKAHALPPQRRDLHPRPARMGL